MDEKASKLLYSRSKTIQISVDARTVRNDWKILFRMSHSANHSDLSSLHSVPIKNPLYDEDGKKQVKRKKVSADTWATALAAVNSGMPLKKAAAVYV
ncbi:hypothetical protein ON010_g9145 [Phytophthora cinnamomi]|nr:hypothetical protein ON010_g9145 [Phytophthora cinnamomi]